MVKRNIGETTFYGVVGAANERKCFSSICLKQG